MRVQHYYTPGLLKHK